MNTVKVVNHGDAEFVIEAKNTQIVLGTEGKNLTALDGFLGSIGACMGFYVRLFSSQEKIDLNGFSVAVDGELSAERPYRFTSLAITVALPGVSLDSETQAKMADFVRSCPLYHSLVVAPRIDVRIQ
jgi:uncharacterized OsmC-like protein